MYILFDEWKLKLLLKVDVEADVEADVEYSSAFTGDIGGVFRFLDTLRSDTNGGIGDNGDIGEDGTDEFLDRVLTVL